LSESDAQPVGRMIDEQLGTFENGQLRLWGSRCASCGTVTFPQQDSCPSCTRGGAEPFPLPRVGRLWSWTVQGFPPKSPPYAGSAEHFQPFGVGYVELGGELRVESILTTADPDALAIGMAMRLVAIPVVGRDGEGLVTFAFEPADVPAP
jgi:uncharacterized OB-fold protein